MPSAHEPGNGSRRSKAGSASSRESINHDALPQQQQYQQQQQQKQQKQQQQQQQQAWMQQGGVQQNGQGWMPSEVERPRGGNSGNQEMPPIEYVDAGGSGGRGGHGHVHGRGHSHSGSGSGSSSSYDRLLFDRAALERQRCKDCHAPVAWRNTDDTLSRSIYGNQEVRDIQAKLLEVLAAGGLSLADIGDLVGGGGGSSSSSSLVVPAASLSIPMDARMSGNQAAAGRGGVDPSSMDSALKPTVWLAAKFAVEDEKREWFFYNRNPQRPFIASNYCEEHTCRHFFTREKCMFKKPTYDAVCNQHAVCPVVGCREGKGQYVDGQRADHIVLHFLRHAFCSNHRCAAPGCELLRDELGKGNFGQFCAMHRCQYRGCVKPSLDRRPFCSKHKCQTTNCQKLAVAGLELCKTHVVCSQKDCSQPRVPLPEAFAVKSSERTECGIEIFDRRLYLSYCQEHGFCASHSCQGLRVKSSIHCRKHACSERGCTIVRRDKLFRYCDQHRCDMDGCTSPKAWKDDQRTRENFCGAHVCRESDCSAGVPDLHLYCEDHECEARDCTAETANDGLCLEHDKLRLKKDVKDAAKKETGEWMHMLYAYPPPGDVGGSYHDVRRSRHAYGGHGRRVSRRYASPSPSPSDTAFSDDGESPEPSPPGRANNRSSNAGGGGLGGNRLSGGLVGAIPMRPAGQIAGKPSVQIAGKPAGQQGRHATDESETDWQELGPRNV